MHYRRQQEQKLHRKRAQKHRLINKAVSQKKLDAEMNMLIEASQSIADKLGYPIIVTRIVPKSKASTNYEYIINYVSNDCYDDWHHYFDLHLRWGNVMVGNTYSNI